MLVFSSCSEFRAMDKSTNPVTLSVIHHSQNPSDYNIDVPVIAARDQHCAAVVFVRLLRPDIHRAGSRCSPQKLVDTHVSRQQFWHVILHSESRACNKETHEE
jgi:hypothetical protein